jgi:hypothetical protein
MLLSFLVGWASNGHTDLTLNVKLDGKFGPVGARLLEQFQHDLPHQVSEIGYLGPETRHHMKHSFGFDLEEALRINGIGSSAFIQPNGKMIPWRPQNQ